MRLEQKYLLLILTATVMGTDVCADDEEYTKPISNPFGDSQMIVEEKSRSVLFRGKNIDGQSVEVELPQGEQSISSMTLPVQDTIPGSAQPYRKELPQNYTDQKSTYTDREIASRLPKNAPEEDWRRTRVEQELGLQPTEDSTPQQDKSYLAGIDLIKQLYRGGRYEAALIESDKMLRTYATDPKLYEMRGTLLDRLGYYDLALDSWGESVRLNPRNLSLKKYVDRKTTIYRRVAGEGVKK